jgi:iron complex outermembrane receptor protein
MSFAPVLPRHNRLYTAVLLAGLATLPAHAQQADIDQAQTLQQVVVTGVRASSRTALE